MLLSVVTITYNACSTIERTILSVINQDYKDVEYIVIDGGSTDGTIDIVSRYIDSIDCFVSEPDSGISEAMNKGVNVANGEYVIFLHADDYFVNNYSLSHAVRYLVSGKDLYIFDIELDYINTVVYARPHGLSWKSNFKTGVFHQGSFCARKLFKQIGMFDPSLKIVMDYDFFLRCYRAKISYEMISCSLTVMSMFGISSRKDWPSQRQRFVEERRVHAKHCQNGMWKIIYCIYWPTYLLYRWLRSFPQWSLM